MSINDDVRGRTYKRAYVYLMVMNLKCSSFVLQPKSVRTYSEIFVTIVVKRFLSNKKLTNILNFSKNYPNLIIA